MHVAGAAAFPTPEQLHSVQGYPGRCGGEPIHGEVVGAAPENLCFPGSFGSRESKQPVLLPWTTLPMAWSGSTVWQGWEGKGLCWKSTDV